MASEIGERFWEQACDDAASTRNWIFVPTSERHAQPETGLHDDSFEVAFFEGLIDYAHKNNVNSHVIAVLRMQYDILDRLQKAQSIDDKQSLQTQLDQIKANNQQLYAEAMLLRQCYTTYLLDEHELRYKQHEPQLTSRTQSTYLY